MENRTLMIGGGAALLAGMFFFWPRKPAATVESKSNGASQAPMPLFISGAGGSPLPANAQAAQEPLGGWQWAPPAVDIANDPNVEIARINASVQQASIAAQKEVAMAMLPTATTTAPASVAAAGVRPPSAITTPMDQAVLFIQSLPDISSNSAAYAVYDKAKQFGYNAYDVAEAYGRAGYDVSVSAINSFVASNNLAPL